MMGSLKRIEERNIPVTRWFTKSTSKWSLERNRRDDEKIVKERSSKWSWGEPSGERRDGYRSETSEPVKQFILFHFQRHNVIGASGLLNSRPVCYSTPSRRNTVNTGSSAPIAHFGDSSYRCSVDYFWRVGAKTRFDNPRNHSPDKVTPRC